MKNFNLLFVLIVLSYKFQAQVDPLPGPSPLIPGIIDGVVSKEDIITQTKMEYSHVRDADYTWSKRVFSRIDAREKMNHTLFFPYDNFIDAANDEPWTPPKSLKDINDPKWVRDDKNWSLWTIILQSIFLDQLTVYSPEPEIDKSMFDVEANNKFPEDGYSFKYPILPTIINAKKSYFLDGKYSTKINSVISSGSKSNVRYLEFSVVKRDLDGKPLGSPLNYGYNRGPLTETFDQWVTRLTTVGDTSQPDLQITDFKEFSEYIADPDERLKFEKRWGEAKPNSELKEPQIARFISSSSITAYNIKEDWYFDKNRSKLERRIIAIAPVGRYNADPNLNKDGYLNRYENFIFVNKDGNFVNSKNELIDMKTAKIVEKEIFWIYFHELRDVIVNYYAYNDKNDAQWDSFDDLFIQRRFSSVAYKTSDKFDRDIEEYKFGIDRLYEAERIKEEIRNWEQNIWNY